MSGLLDTVLKMLLGHVVLINLTFQSQKPPNFKVVLEW